jgi:hypothetical protein
MVGVHEDLWRVAERTSHPVTVPKWTHTGHRGAVWNL